MPEILMEPPDALRPFAHTLRLAGRPLHVFLAGPESAPPLILLHGLGDEGDTWRHLIAPLAEQHRVIAPDLPGFGRSAPLPGAASVTAFARMIAALMGELRVTSAVLVGHSGGAMVAQRLALAAPQLVERLVLVAGSLPVERSMPPRSPVYAFLTPGVGELAYSSLRRSHEQAYATLRPYYADFDALPEEEREFLYRRVWARVWSDTQRAAFLSWLRWLAIDTATRSDYYRERLARCAVPTRLVWGDGDLIASRAGGDAVAALVPGATMQTIVGCGHNPQHERPVELLALIES